MTNTYRASQIERLTLWINKMRNIEELKKIGMSRRLVITFTAALILGACTTTPPLEQIAVSKAAITNANGAGSNEFAPYEIKTAIEKMNAAEQAMKDKNYALAEKLAKEAQVDAQLATVMSRSAKAKKAADEVQEDSRVLRKEIERKNK
jgi:hypothetical protein